MDKPNPLERAFHILAATVVDEETRGIRFTPRSYVLDLEGILEFDDNKKNTEYQQPCLACERERERGSWNYSKEHIYNFLLKYL